MKGKVGVSSWDTYTSPFLYSGGYTSSAPSTLRDPTRRTPCTPVLDPQTTRGNRYVSFPDYRPLRPNTTPRPVSYDHKNRLVEEKTTGGGRRGHLPDLAGGPSHGARHRGSPLCSRDRPRLTVAGEGPPQVVQVEARDTLVSGPAVVGPVPWSRGPVIADETSPDTHRPSRGAGANSSGRRWGRVQVWRVVTTRGKDSYSYKRMYWSRCNTLRGVKCKDINRRHKVNIVGYDEESKGT